MAEAAAANVIVMAVGKRQKKGEKRKKRKKIISIFTTFIYIKVIVGVFSEFSCSAFSLKAKLLCVRIYFVDIGVWRRRKGFIH